MHDKSDMIFVYFAKSTLTGEKYLDYFQQLTIIV